MPQISIGLTTSGKDILIDINNWKDVSIFDFFQGFSRRDHFDALLATQRLYTWELHRTPQDKPWCTSLGTTELYFARVLRQREIGDFKTALGIHTVFDAGDYGASLLHSHFRKKQMPAQDAARETPAEAFVFWPHRGAQGAFAPRVRGLGADSPQEPHTKLRRHSHRLTAPRKSQIRRC